MRYLVIEIGCLECAADQSCEPDVTLRTDSRDDAIAAARKSHYTREWDRFVVDTADGTVIEVNGDA